MQSTSAPQISTDVARATPLPRRIPGASLRPVTRLHPRPTPPRSVFAPDAKQVTAWRELAEIVANGEDPNGPAIPGLPGQRKPSGNAA